MYVFVYDKKKLTESVNKFIYELLTKLRKKIAKLTNGNLLTKANLLYIFDIQILKGTTLFVTQVKNQNQSKCCDDF